MSKKHRNQRWKEQQTQNNSSNATGENIVNNATTDNNKMETTSVNKVEDNKTVQNKDNMKSKHDVTSKDKAGRDVGNMSRDNLNNEKNIQNEDIKVDRDSTEEHQMNQRVSSAEKTNAPVKSFTDTTMNTSVTRPDNHMTDEDTPDDVVEVDSASHSVEGEREMHLQRLKIAVRMIQQEIEHMANSRVL